MLSTVIYSQKSQKVPSLQNRLQYSIRVHCYLSIRYSVYATLLSHHALSHIVFAYIDTQILRRKAFCFSLPTDFSTNVNVNLHMPCLQCYYCYGYYAGVGKLGGRHSTAHSPHITCITLFISCFITRILVSPRTSGSPAPVSRYDVILKI